MRKIFSLFALILALCFVLCACSPQTPPDISVPDDPSTPVEPSDHDATGAEIQPDASDPKALFETFKKVFELYQSNHLYEKDSKDILLDTIQNILYLHPEMFEEIMFALAKSEDPYSLYYTEQEFYDYSNQKAYSGIGVTVSFRDGYTLCSYVNPDGPSAKADIQEGDVIVTIDGKFGGKLASDDLLATVRGDSGTDVEIGVFRPSDKKMHYSVITRASIYSPTVLWEYKESGGKTYAVATVNDFSGARTFREFVDFINDSAERGVDDVIIDLRGNPGGDFSVCLEFINVCIPDKNVLICSTSGRGGEVLETFSTTGVGHKFGNLVILVNGGSASASELFAITLQEYGLAKIVGTQTFGKAVGQSRLTFPEGDVLSLTTFELVSAHGNRYNGTGVIPDIIVENPDMVVPDYGFAALDESNYKSAVFGGENDAVKALRQRLAYLELLESENGAFDQTVSDALKAYQAMMRLEKTGALDEATFNSLTELFSVVLCIGTIEDVQMATAIKELLG